MAQKQFCKKHDPNTAEARSAAARHSDTLRIDGSIQNAGARPAGGSGHFGQWRIWPPDGRPSLRGAYVSALNDPALKSEADKRQYEMEPVTGEKLEALAKDVMTQPAAVIERMKKILAP